MKTVVMVISIIILLFADPIYAKDSSGKSPITEVKIDFVKKNILMGLRSGNSGLMESCLILISNVKLLYPETNVTEILTVIDSLAISNPSGMFRYKAFLVSNILAHPESFDRDNALYTRYADRFFAAASRLLQHD